MAFDATQWSHTVKLTGLNPASTCVGQKLFVNDSVLDDLVDQNDDPVDFFSIIRADGGDIRFSSDPAGSNELPLHLIYITASEIAMMLRKPAYDITETDIYCSFGKSDETLRADTHSFGSQSVYSDNIGYCHFDDPVTGNGDVVSASGSASGNTIGSVSSVDGLISKAFRTNGSDTSIGVKAPCVINPQNPFTISTLVKFLSIDASIDPYVWCFNPGDDSERFSLGVDVSAGNKWKIFSSGETPGAGTSTVSTATWYKTDLVFDGTDIHLYVNGSLEYSVTPTGPGWKSQTTPSTFVAGGRYVSYFDIVSQEVHGDFDLFETMQSAKSAAQINIEYLNLGGPDAFWTVDTVNNRGAGSSIVPGTFSVIASAVSSLSGHKISSSDIDIVGECVAQWESHKRSISTLSISSAGRVDFVANKMGYSSVVASARLSFTMTAYKTGLDAWSVDANSASSWQSFKNARASIAAIASAATATEGLKTAYGDFAVVAVGTVRFSASNIDIRTGIFSVQADVIASFSSHKTAMASNNVNAAGNAKLNAIKTAISAFNIAASGEASLFAQKWAYANWQPVAAGKARFTGLSDAVERHYKTFRLQGVLISTTLPGVLKSTQLEGKI